MKPMLAIIFPALMIACNPGTEPDNNRAGNPFFTGLNEPVQYANIGHKHIGDYARITSVDAGVALERIRSEKSPDFRNIFVAFDEVVNELNKAGSNCFMLYWVSTDSLSRIKGLEGYQLLDSLITSLTADSSIYSQMVAFADSKAYEKLRGHRKIFVDDVMQ